MTANILSPESQDDTIEILRGHEPAEILIAGGQTTWTAHDPEFPAATILSTKKLNRVIDYPDRDMTVTVQTGMTIAELQRGLSTHKQRLPIDVPTAERATLGGAIACNISSPGRFGYGTLRDYVIGISAIDGQGRMFSAGGKVVKNVAGYDLCKLLIGSRGELAVITEVTLKLRPAFEKRNAIVIAFDGGKSLERLLVDLNRSKTRPVALELLNGIAATSILQNITPDVPLDRSFLIAVFEGTESEVTWQTDALKTEIEAHQPLEIIGCSEDESCQIYDALVGFQAEMSGPLSFRATFPKSMSDKLLRIANQSEVGLQIHTGNGVAYGQFPASCNTAEHAQRMLATFNSELNQCSGAISMTRCPSRWRNVIATTPLPKSVSQLAESIKQMLDPNRRFRTWLPNV